MEQRDEKIQFVEKIGTFFETQHLPRIAGMILGWLLICDPPVQSAKAIGESLGISKGSVSTTMRLLSEMGMVEKVGQVGIRGDFYRIHPQTGEHLLLARQREFINLHNLVNEGLELINSSDPAARQRLLDLSRMCGLAIEEIPLMIARIKKTEASPVNSGNA